MDSFVSIFAATDPSLLREVRTEQVCQGLRVFTAVRILGAIDERVNEWFFALFGQNAVSPTFLNGRLFSQSVLTRKRKAEKSILQQYVPIASRALLLFRSSALVSTCMQERRPHANLHWKKGSRTGLAMQAVTRALSVLQK